jgi:pilus assembly protein CpaC
VQFLGPNNTSFTVNAFERYGVSRILAEPTVTAISGENAKFVVGGEVPVPSSSSCVQFGAVPVPSSQALCSPAVAYKPVGIELNFTPVVLSEGRILLRIATEVTEVDNQNSFTYAGVTVPGFRTRKHETSVELPSGGSIATAGLLEQKSRNSINGLPAVMNLPILGTLFRSRDYLRQETELLIVITPYIVRPVAPSEIAKPDDGFADASDPQGWLLGRVNRLYSSRNNPEAVQNYKGRFGFITD